VIDAARWPAVVGAAGLSGMARQIALNCVPASFADGALVLRLDESSAFSRSPAVEEKLAQGLSKYLGRDIRVIFEVSPSDLATPARQRAIADQDRALRAVSAFDQDPAVKGLQERFGAEVDAASVKPANP
jgi:DNA polymerase-3 subunit gamma/tau